MQSSASGLHMHKLPDLQPQQKQRKPLLIGQKMPKHDSYIRKVQEEHRIPRRNHPHTENMDATKAKLSAHRSTCNTREGQQQTK